VEAAATRYSAPDGPPASPEGPTWRERVKLSIAGREPTPLEREVIGLRQELGYWKRQHADGLERERRLAEQVAELVAEVRDLKQRLFGRSTERGSKGKDDSGGANPKSSGRNRGQQPNSPGHGRRRHDGLPARPEDRELSPDECQCGRCGKPFEQIAGTEDSEVIEVEVRAHRRVIKRGRYRSTCDCDETPNIVVAPPAPRLFEKGAYGISFWVMVLIDKFLFQRPTHRLLEDLRLTLGFDVSQGTVTDGLKRMLPLLEPLYDELLAVNASGSRWHADETRWLVYCGPRGSKRWYLWVFRSESTVVYRVDPSRSARVPKEHFGPDAKGILNVDRYVAYICMANDEGCKIQLAWCWAHVRRDFLKVAKSWPEHQTWALGWVELIGNLYHLNHRRLELEEAGNPFAEAQQRLESAVENMKTQWSDELKDDDLHLARRKVLKSLKRHWPGLVLFVEHPEVSMDNNQAERDIRGPVVGRKAYHGSGAVWSARLAAVMFTLLQTALLWDLNPKTWLTSYLTACAENGGKAPADAVRWLPHNLEDELRERLRAPPAPLFGDTL
jgi:transposase